MLEFHGTPKSSMIFIVKLWFSKAFKSSTASIKISNFSDTKMFSIEKLKFFSHKGEICHFRIEILSVIQNCNIFYQNALVFSRTQKLDAFHCKNICIKGNFLRHTKSIVFHQEPVQASKSSKFFIKTSIYSGP